jgi:hypothetical protein
MAEHWTLRLRSGSKVTKEQHGSLDEALDALARAIDATHVDRVGPARVFRREIAPADQVSVRAEVAGPQRFFARVNGGVDVRGDGSPEAFTGRVNRRPLSG